MMDEDRTMGAADDHLTAAENWLVLAEGQRETLEGGADPHDAADAVASGMQAGLLFSTAATLADLHRKMAETYWGYPRTLTSVSTPDWITHPVPDGQGGLIDASAEPADSCDCCASGLFNADGEAPSLCADCGHAGDRHNGNAPMKGGDVPVSEFSRGLDAEKARRDFALPETPIRLEDFTNPQGTSLADLGDDERRDLITTLARSLPSEKPKPWRSPGGAGQWHG